MVSSTLSDPNLRIVFWIGVGVVILTVVLGARIMALRLSLVRAKRREEQIIEIWRPILNAAIVESVPVNLPVLSQRDSIIFLKLWAHLQASLRGKANKTLNELGYRLGIDVRARHLLDKGNPAEQLLATLTLGFLRDHEAWTGLEQQVKKTDSTVSLYAVWAMLKIDPQTALSRLTLVVIERGDWPLSQVVSILEDVKESYIPFLINVLPELDKAHLPRALYIAQGLRIALPSALHENLLRHPSIEIVVAALRIAADPVLLDHIRSMALHDDWRIRVQVAKILGRMGDRSDIDTLKRLLEDSHWWVRYRAAQALVSSPFFVRQGIETLIRETDDHFASEMLKQVLMEDRTP